MEETDDPWHSAHRKQQDLIDAPWADNNRFDVYLADDVISVVGCVGQYQLCNPYLSKGHQCSPFASYLDSLNNTGNLWPEPEKWEKLKWLVDSFLAFDPARVPGDLGIASLTSRNSLNGRFQGPLPTNQWQLEIEYWFKAQLASLQLQGVDDASGPPEPSMRKYILPPKDVDGTRYFCQNQVRNLTHLFRT